MCMRVLYIYLCKYINTLAGTLLKSSFTTAMLRTCTDRTCDAGEITKTTKTTTYYKVLVEHYSINNGLPSTLFDFDLYETVVRG